LAATTNIYLKTKHFNFLSVGNREKLIMK